MPLCDPNKDFFGITVQKCLYGKKQVEYLIEYAIQFWNAYIQNRKFLSIVSNEAHEQTLEVLKYMDDSIYNFFNYLYNNNLLKDTTILFLSDHGVVIPSIYYLFNFYRLESNLPMLFILINDHKNKTFEEQYKYIHENQQSFITAYDIYNTMSHIIFGNKYITLKNKTWNNDSPKSPYGESLFLKMDQKERKSKNFNKNMSQNICI